MEYTIKDKLLALIFPAVCVLYGLLEVRFSVSGAAGIFSNAVPVLAILGGLITGFTAVRLKVNFVPYLKILTIGTVITYLIYILLEGYFFNPMTTDIFVMIVLAGAVFLMTVKMPEDAGARDRLLVAFANPVLYSLLNKLCGLLENYLYDAGALVK